MESTLGERIWEVSGLRDGMRVMRLSNVLSICSVV